MAVFRCLSCGYERQVADDLAGRAFSCPKCGSAGNVTAQSARYPDVPFAQSGGEHATSSSWAQRAVAPPRPAGPDVNGFDVAGLVLSVLSAVVAVVPICGLVSIPFSVVALVLGVIGLSTARSRGQRTGKRLSIAAIAVSVVAVFGSILWTGIVMTAVDRGSNRTTVTPSPPAVRVTTPGPYRPPPMPDVVTLDEYNRLREGMSYAEAVAVIGEPGTRWATAQYATGRIVTYRWLNRSSGGEVQAKFENGKLTEKTQSGLE